MMSISATGFLVEKPELQYVGSNSTKCEFTVLAPRQTRRNNEWETVWERAVFVAWGEEAEIIASRMDKGSNVVCIGTQETSSWVDHQGQKRYMTKYKLSAWSIQRPSQDANRAQRPAPSGDSQPRAMPSRTYESAYGAPASRPSQPGSHVAQEGLRDEYQSAATPPRRIQDSPEHGDDPILM